MCVCSRADGVACEGQSLFRFQIQTWIGGGEGGYFYMFTLVSQEDVG